MMKLVILSIMMAGAIATPISQTMNMGDDGTYQFFYETGQDGGRHSRSETRNKDGVVVGKFSYEDPTGELRVVNYRADNFGYVAKGDVSVVGAPQGQFPQESEETRDPNIVEIAHDTQENSLQEEERPQETSQDPSTADAPDQDTDDIKSLKLEAASEDGPPDGFPEGFFLHQFHGLRRFPEPIKEVEEQDSEAKPEVPKESSTTTEKPEEQSPPATPTANFPPILPFHNFAAQPWPVSYYHPSLQQQTMYVYSYRQPNAYGYHYAY